MEIEICPVRRIYIREVKVSTETAKAKVRYKFLDQDNNIRGSYQYWMCPSVYSNEELEQIKVGSKYWMNAIALDAKYCHDDWVTTKGYYWTRLELILEPQIIKFSHGEIG